MTPETFRVLTARNPHPSLLLATDGRVLAANPAGRHLLGFDGSDGPEGKSLESLVGDPGERVAEALAAWASSGTATGRTLRFSLPERRARYRCEGLLVTTPGERPEPRVVVHCVPLDPPRPGATPLRPVPGRHGGRAAPAGARESGAAHASSPVADPAPGAAAPGPARPGASRRTSASSPRAVGKMEAMGSLAGGVAHDFNNLLTVIKAEIELAQECAPLAEPVRDSLAAAHEAVAQAEALVGRLLAFSRRQLVRAVEIDLRQLVSDAVDELRPHLEGPDVALVVEHGPGALPVMADRAQLRAVVHTLVRNAREALPAEGGTLRVRTSAERIDAAFVRSNPGSVEGSYVALFVEDDGRGMAPEVQARIFEPFFTTKGRGAGRGLGLAQAFGIVKALGGYVRVESAPDEGTTFTVYLPR